MKISIQTIVFNAESTLPTGMLTKNIEQWIGIADEIIIVEGATGKYSDGSTNMFTTDGKSTDRTREILQDLQNKYPAQIKLILSNGFWDGKTAMCNAAASTATGDYLWQVDSDEFYHEDDIPAIIKLLETSKPDAVHFYANHFWGGYKSIMGNDQPWGNGMPWMRLFRHTPGSRWISHEPPEYQLYNGTICNKGHVITRDQTNSMGIKLFHYSYVEKSQINFKSQFFRNSQYPLFWEQWKADNNTRVFGAKTITFTGKHPKAVLSLIGGLK